MADERMAAERPMGSVILALLFIVLGVANLWQAIPHLLRPEFADVLALYWLQCAAGVLSLATGVAAWRRRGWGAWTALAWGGVMAATVLLVPVLLVLPPASLVGFYVAAGLLMAFGAFAAWYLWTRRAGATEGSAAR